MHIRAYWTDVVDDLEKYSKTVDPENSGLITRQQWFNEACEILALQGADCQCGKPAFFHTARYDQQIRESAFHVAFLKGHTELEKAMIKDGMSYRSNCPYIQVHLSACRRQRRNALQWAAQEGCNDTVMRLLEAMGTNLDGWAVVLQIASSRGNMELVESLFTRIWDISTITDHELQIATGEAAEHGHWEIYQKIYNKKSHHVDPEVLGNAAETGQWDILDRFLRPGDHYNNDIPRMSFFNRAMIGAARKGRFEIYRKILERWGEEENDKPISALRMRDKSSGIAEGGSVDILRFHLESGLKVNALEIMAESSYLGHLEMIQYIWDGELKKRQEAEDFALTEFVDVFRASLMWAVRQNHVETVRWLLDRIGTGVLSDSKDLIWKEHTPSEMNLLAMAIDTGLKEMTDFLLERRADMGVDFELWRIDNLDFTSAARRERKSNLESHRRSGTSLDYKTLEMAPQWVAEERLKMALAFYSA